MRTSWRCDPRALCAAREPLSKVSRGVVVEESQLFRTTYSLFA